MKKSRIPCRQLLTLLIIAAAAMITASTINAQTSSVDLSFNAIPARTSTSVSDFELQPNGKILTFGFGGARIFNGVVKYQIARLNADGSLDNSFDCAACDFSISSVRVQPDGKIIAAGFYPNNGGTSVPTIKRLNADGTIDATFAASLSFSTSVKVRLIQPDGKILIVTSYYNGFNNGYTVSRLNPNGEPDSSFTNINLTPSRSSPAYVNQLQLHAGGKILLATARNSLGIYGTLYRYNADGTRDTAFEPPTLSIGNSTASAYISDFDVQADGGIVIAGRFDSVNSLSRVNIARVMTAGNVDLSFTQTNVFTGTEYLSQIKVLADGKILVSSAPVYNPGFPPPDSFSRLVRLNADGSLDGTFSAPYNFLEITKLIVEATGKILISYSVTEIEATTAVETLKVLSKLPFELSRCVR